MKMKSQQHSFHTEEMDFYEEKGRLDMDKVYKIWSCDGVKGKNMALSILNVIMLRFNFLVFQDLNM